jgi:2',3'-cyclic-nucleotide 2'-phosphodiesterase (5'-nucleotidase family)
MTMSRTSLVWTIALAGVLGLAVPAAAPAQVSFTVLHTNDFHGQLEPAGANPGAARVAAVINGVRTTVGAGNVLLVDAGDAMQGSLLSNLYKGEPTVAYFRTIWYQAAALGNHEFDWGQQVLAQRAAQASYTYLAANVVSGTCDPANWTSPPFATPYQILSVGSPAVDVAFIAG